MELTFEQAQANVGLTVTLVTKTPLTKTRVCTITGTAVGRPNGKTKREKRDRLIVRYGDVVEYVLPEEITKIAADGRQVKTPTEESA